MKSYETKRILITVKTYPSPARKTVEASCTGGITEDGEWIRLFPVPFRRLDTDKRFKRYQWIEAPVTKANNDSRVESYHPDLDAMRMITEPLATTRNWQLRKDIVYPLMSETLCGLQELRDRGKQPTLGIFKPRIKRLVIEPDSDRWTPEQVAKLSQLTLFDQQPLSPLEKIPFKFRYDFDCLAPNCQGHRMICVDWEMAQSYRSWLKLYGSDWEAKFRQKYEADMINHFDTHFYVGTLAMFPSEWIIVGLFYPLP